MRQLLALALITGCTGEIVGDSPLAPEPVPTSGAPLCSTSSYAPGMLRLLTPAEYDRTLQAAAKSLGLAATPGFVKLDGTHLPAGALSFEYSDAVIKNAVTLGRAVALDRARLTPVCDGSVDENACVRSLSMVIGRVAFRRPLTGAEQDRLAGRFTALRAGWSFAIAVQGAVEMLLGSPAFFHRTEIGVPVAGRPGVRQLTSHEMASALAYAITGGPPDDDLMRVADAGALTDPAQIDAQVTRLLASKTGVAGLTHFFVSLLGVDRVLSLPKNLTAFPFYKSTVPGLLFESFRRQAEVLVADPDATFESFLTSNTAYVRSELSPLFGNKAAPASDFALMPVETTRAGLYTHPAFLAAVADDLQPKPVHRAHAALDGLLCVRLPNPPAEAAEAKPPTDPRLTSRQKFEIMTGAPLCASCHRVLNPISFAFGSFDAVGRTRTMDGKEAIDPSGAVALPDGRALPFTDARSLFTALAAEAPARQCFVDNWYEYLLGRTLDTADDCSRQRSFGKAGNVQALVRSVFLSDSFRFRKGAA